MTDNQIKIAIAETLYRETFDGRLRQKETIPDYLNDRDACAEFERSLDEIEAVEYVIQVDRLAHMNAFHAITATARQRCEAYLRTKGLWKEDAI